MKIFGVVVLYNPDINVIQNIKTYINQLDKLYIIDNSEVYNETVISELQKLIKAEYISNNGNKGIAFALNLAAKEALKHNATWFLTMDQDSEFQTDNLSKLINFTQKQDPKTVGIVSPFHQSVLISHTKGEIEEVLLTMTSGNLISLYSYEKIEGFDERFFIDAVDWDYCLRLNLSGLKVLRLNNVFLKHELGKNPKIIKTFFGKERVIQNYNFIRRYYITRNKLLMYSLYKKDYSSLSMRWFISLYSDVRNIVLYEKEKIIKLKSVALGIKDFYFQHFGKREFHKQ